MKSFWGFEYKKVAMWTEFGAFTANPLQSANKHRNTAHGDSWREKINKKKNKKHEVTEIIESMLQNYRLNQTKRNLGDPQLLAPPSELQRKELRIKYSIAFLNLIDTYRNLIGKAVSSPGWSIVDLPPSPGGSCHLTS